MAKKAKKIKTNKGLKLEIVNPNAAGIDVSFLLSSVFGLDACQQQRNSGYGYII